nr:ribonuclease H-like domain-containing protein [Tanacetum cinerariifolium]
MVTHFCIANNRPVERLTLHVSSVSLLPRFYHEAFIDVNWHSAMRDEYNALIKNSTWTLVPRLPNVNVVRCMWLFRHKYLADGTLSRYKARPVANGSTQLEGVDVDETFSLVVKTETIRTGFAMTDLGSLIYFLGISVTRDSSGMFLSQKKYTVEILERASMVHCNPSRTPVDTESKLSTTGDVVSDPTFIGVLQVLCSILLLLDLIFIMLFSRAEAEYRGVANAVVETCWLHNLLRELHTPLSFDTLVYYDNVSAVYLSTNPVQHQRKKHIKIDIHFVRDLVATGQVRVLHVPSRYQFTDFFTKGLPTALLEEFRSSMSVRCPPAQTAGSVSQSICNYPHDL